MKPLKLKTTRKLEIKRETLRALTDDQLGGVVGGRAPTKWCSTLTDFKCDGLCNLTE